MIPKCPRACYMKLTLCFHFLSLYFTVQPDKPVMVMEYWLGWFDQWGKRHHVKDAKTVAETMEEILQFGASVNLYMFHGNDCHLKMII